MWQHMADSWLECRFHEAGTISSLFTLVSPEFVKCLTHSRSLMIVVERTNEWINYENEGISNFLCLPLTGECFFSPNLWLQSWLLCKGPLFQRKLNGGLWEQPLIRKLPRASGKKKRGWKLWWEQPPEMPVLFDQKSSVSWGSHYGSWSNFYLNMYSSLNLKCKTLCDGA